MASPTSPSSAFNILSDTRPEDHTMPAFMVSSSRGFLPRAEPIVKLPPDFDALESILSRMSIKTISGAPGLLATCELGDAVHKDLPDLSDAIERYKEDLPLMNALYRDYAFLASAYLLEPCHGRFMEGEEYGLGRQKLPKNIALPFVRVAAIAGFKPFMEYAGSYALFNYRLEDPSLGLEYSNLRLTRAFEHGLDPTSSEAGFVLVHVDMVQHSGPLVSAAAEALKAAESKDRDAFDQALNEVVNSLKQVNSVMNEMWNKSKPGNYTSFRTFIFGITKQSMFPNGVIYEGVSAEPMSFRGESGANDSMIPLADNLLQMTMPDTPLTSILHDFRSYRPGNHREFLEWVHARATLLGVKDFALADPRSALMYLRALNQVRDFRWRHWCFTREYILKRTKHRTATGGSPIVTWLPNQLQAVLDQIIAIEPFCVNIGDAEDIMDLVKSQSISLQKDVAKYCEEREV
ncbi:IDO-domain-containing protein [Tothia fuscella]|uniref:Indoleamine 2,3-dioxygenase n=1 Tax=Tothia fuscella TaxID=1048955 RepID=A0A9P4NGZ8_9PEZI|nr:IDO-domain-containing protein [Tothia fuscella]